MLKHKIISTCFGIGYIKKGGGTVAAIATCLVWYLIAEETHWGGNNSFIESCIVTVALTAIGIWSGNKVESIWGKDSYRVVIDEVVGMSIALIAIPITWQTVLAALVLFRFFDIAKPLYVREMEKFPGGWGVMLDDVLAGIYANLVLQIILFFFFR